MSTIEVVMPACGVLIGCILANLQLKSKKTKHAALLDRAVWSANLVGVSLLGSTILIALLWILATYYLHGPV